MRLTFTASLLAAGLCAVLATPAAAGMKLNLQTKTYSIAGRTGAELVKAMDRKGPKHGFTAHAIALTTYAVDWDLKVKKDNGGCRLTEAIGTLNLTYTFPSAEQDLPPALEQRWMRFSEGVRAHELNHGRIAQAMVRETARSIEGLTETQDRFCIKTRHQAKRRIKALEDEYEARQVAFDRSEHGKGGHVQRLVEALVGGPLRGS
jgi:predicted secreted Zn-dependent protease